MGWLYMATCAFDFIVFPVAWSILQAITKAPLTQWMPLTLQGAGLFHLAMGAVLGIAAYGRTQEKLGGAAGNGIGGGFPGAPGGGGFPSAPGGGGFGSTPSTGFGGTQTGGGFGSTPSTGGGFGSTPSTGFGSTTPSFPTPSPTPSFGAGTTSNGFNPAPAFGAAPSTSPVTGVTNPNWGQGKPDAPKSANPAARMVISHEEEDADAKIK